MYIYIYTHKIQIFMLAFKQNCGVGLQLPTYKRASTLREKLRYAIKSNTGFELSWPSSLPRILLRKWQASRSISRLSCKWDPNSQAHPSLRCSLRLLRDVISINYWKPPISVNRVWHAGWAMLSKHTSSLACKVLCSSNGSILVLLLCRYAGPK